MAFSSAKMTNVVKPDQSGSFFEGVSTTMTLAQWIRDSGERIFRDQTDCLYTIPVGEARNIPYLWGLEDFKVSSRSGPVIRLVGDHSTIQITTREDIDKLSYFTVCGICDALMVGSVEGILFDINRGMVKGQLTVDSLGNFLTIS